MFIEEYGFVIGICRGSSDEEFYMKSVYYTGQEMEYEDGIITLYHNGNTLSDLGVIWKQEDCAEPYMLRFDTYDTLNKGKNQFSKELSYNPDEDMIKVLLNLSAIRAAKMEMPILAEAIKKLCI